MKHYSFRGASGTKQAMSPKLYDAISEKFYNIWGAHAGWAHSVRLMHPYEEHGAHCLQVLFTADLKAFSDYGLLTPSPSPSKIATFSKPPKGRSSVLVGSPGKRRAKQVRTRDALEQGSALRTEDNPIEASSLAERVKKRQRASRGPS
jgi:N-glycosylase/DNA lyase